MDGYSWRSFADWDENSLICWRRTRSRIGAFRGKIKRNRDWTSLGKAAKWIGQLPRKMTISTEKLRASQGTKAPLNLSERGKYR